MNRTLICKKPAGFWTAILAVTVALVTVAAVEAQTATRTLPASYTAGTPVAVSIGTTPGAGTSAYAVEDAPPAGWTVSAVDNGGAFDAVNGKVKWGPFFDNTVRTLGYQATPPAGTTGTKTFAGTASFDGAGVAIGGTSAIGDGTPSRFTLALTSSPAGGGTIGAVPAPGIDGKYASGTVVTLTATANGGFAFGSWSGAATGTANSVQVTMSADRSVTANFTATLRYTLALTSSPAGGGTIGAVPAPGVDGKYADGAVVTLTATASGGFTFGSWSGAATGTANSVQVTMSADRSVTANFTATGGATATRTLPAIYTAGSPVAVSIATTPSAATSAYAVEDTPPAGWTVSAVDNGGAFDAVNGKVKWGPFFDNTVRTLGYQATPTAGTTGAHTFSGTASFDGVGVAIGGTSVISDVVLRFALTLASNPVGSGTIAANPAPGVDGKYAPGTVVTLTATANAGFGFDSWSGDASGTNSQVQVTMNANRSATANFETALPFTSLVGMYYGLVQSPVGDPVNHAENGSITVKVTKKGTFTSSIVAGGVKKSVKGVFDAAGNSSPIQVTKKGVLLFTVTIHLQLSNADGLISGEISFPSRDCTLAAKRGLYSKFNPAPLAGVYTMTIAPTGIAVGDPDQPQGKGYATLTVSKKGVGKLVAQPSDGSKKFSRAATVAPDGTWPLFGLLHKKGGFMSGWITFATVAQPAGSAGMLEWVKPVIPSEKYFRLGFGMQCDAVLSKYEYVKGTRVLQLADAQDNARFSLFDGDLGLVPLPRLLTLNFKNKVLNFAGDKFKMTLAAKTGLFSGSFPDPNTGKARKFGGVILQKQNIGAGLFRGVNETGGVLFEAAP